MFGFNDRTRFRIWHLFHSESKNYGYLYSKEFQEALQRKDEAVFNYIHRFRQN